MDYELSINNFNDYQILFNESPDSKVFNSIEWLKNFGEIKIFTVKYNEKIIAGVCVLISKKFNLIGNHCPPFTPYYHPIFNIETSGNRTIQNKSIELILKELNKFSINDFIFKYSDFSMHPYHWNGYELTAKISTIINRKFEDWLKSINKNKLRDIKKLQSLLEENKIYLKYNCEFKEFENMISETEKIKKFKFNPIFKKIFFSNNSYTGNLVVFSEDNVPLNGICYAFDKNNAYNLINVSNSPENIKYNNCNYLIMYELIKKTLEENKTFDFEGSMLKGVEEFYRYMGGEQIPVIRATKTKSFYFNSLKFIKSIRNSLK